MAAAVALTTASKVAFICWGIGWSALDFTGISGHAMFAAAVYPLLLGMLAPATPRVAPWLAMAAGAALALLVGVWRTTVLAHSWFEVVGGLMLGGVVGVTSLMRGHLTECRFKLWVPLAIATWLLVLPVHAPASNSHALVTRMALALSGRHNPYTRDELRRNGPAIPNEPSAISSAVVSSGPLTAMDGAVEAVLAEIGRVEGSLGSATGGVRDMPARRCAHCTAGSSGAVYQTPSSTRANRR